MKKSKRLDLISTIVKDNDIHSKAEIVDYIDKHFGIKYSVATIGRDLNELKIYKMPSANNERYYRKFNDNAQNEAKTKLINLYKEEIEKVTIKDNYLIIKTSPGFAQSVNFYIDQMNLNEVLGTVGGNDTILILVESTELVAFVHYQLFGETYNNDVI
ncbi:ArgR family transcriptional regulator [Staphylococcus pasteuri]|uniref:arginine repressor n=1 Tax=Staphylococcus pasteuri TaxID=45972 RepID=UPI000BC2D173|nr:ArgR family transcriptional regulator [Staphylococcus pasteuri]ATH61598.1 ArgR family transcriptional regulator [Staphylococcus pasteuri]